MEELVRGTAILYVDYTNYGVFVGFTQFTFAWNLIRYGFYLRYKPAVLDGEEKSNNHTNSQNSGSHTNNHENKIENNPSSLSIIGRHITRFFKNVILPTATDMAVYMAITFFYRPPELTTGRQWNWAIMYKIGVPLTYISVGIIYFGVNLISGLNKISEDLKKL